MTARKNKKAAAEVEVEVEEVLPPAPEVEEQAVVEEVEASSAPVGFARAFLKQDVRINGKLYPRGWAMMPMESYGVWKYAL